MLADLCLALCGDCFCSWYPLSTVVFHIIEHFSRNMGLDWRIEWHKDTCGSVDGITFSWGGGTFSQIKIDLNVPSGLCTNK